MKLTDVKNVVAEVKAACAGARATGPRSERGKLRSALNAVRHGLSGTHLLLPGEDAATYEARLDALFVALDPKDDAQAQVAALVGDDLWKLERIGKIEQGLTLGRIEQLLAQTSMAEKASSTAGALHALGAALATWAQQPIPTERTMEFSRRFRVMQEALSLVATTEVPAELIEACDRKVTRLHGTKGDVEVPLDAYQGLYQAAAEVMGKLLEQGDRVEAAREELRKATATIALPDKEELAKVGKYRRILEDGLLRRLQALEQLRKLAAPAARTEAEQDAARQFRVKLRLVS